MFEAVDLLVVITNMNYNIYQANGACTSDPFFANAKASKPIWRLPLKPNIPLKETIFEGKNDTAKLKAPYPKLTAVISLTTSLGIILLVKLENSKRIII